MHLLLICLVMNRSFCYSNIKNIYKNIKKQHDKLIYMSVCSYKFFFQLLCENTVCFYSLVFSRFFPFCLCGFSGFLTLCYLSLMFMYLLGFSSFAGNTGFLH